MNYRNDRLPKKDRRVGSWSSLHFRCSMRIALNALVPVAYENKFVGWPLSSMLGCF